MQIGIRLIPVLVNWWEDFGGVQFYVDSAVGAGRAPENFYTHLGIRNYFKKWVRTLEPLLWFAGLALKCTALIDRPQSICVSFWQTSVFNFDVNSSAAQHRHPAEKYSQRQNIRRRPDHLRLGAVQRVSVSYVGLLWDSAIFLPATCLPPSWKCTTSGSC